MVTKFKNLSSLCDCIAIETTFVLNNFPKTNIIFSIFLISITIGFYTIVVVAMVTKFKNLFRTTVVSMTIKIIQSA